MSLNGWLILDKPLGMSSAKAVAMVKKILGPKKIGHGGTLDPLATGVLPLALGEATKVCQFMLLSEKAYEFAVCWGEQRDTDDAEGQVIAASPLRPCLKAVESVLERFLGQQQQQPPQYSAIKLQGKRACDRLRDGETVEIPLRAVTIHDLKLQSHTQEESHFYVRCSKGTYVRALARDLAIALETYGYVSKLRRVESGKFTLNQSITLENLANMGEKGLLKEYICPIHDVLDDIPALMVSQEHVHRLQQGQRIPQQDGCSWAQVASGVVAVFDLAGTFWGLATVKEQVLCPKRMMVYD